jgi:cyclopropane-fatty-acyl-phospholipid synthase
MRLTDRSLYRKLFLKSELHAGEAYMDGRMRFENATLRDFLTLFSINRLALRCYPLQKVLRSISRGVQALTASQPTGPGAKRMSPITTTSARLLPVVSRRGDELFLRLFPQRR